MLLDIGIIIFFAYILTGESTDIPLIMYFLERIYFLPILIIFRFASNFIEKANILSLQLQVEKNLRVYLIKRSIQKGELFSSRCNFLY